MNYSDLVTTNVKIRAMLESSSPCPRDFSEGNCGQDCGRKSVCASRCTECYGLFCECDCDSKTTVTPAAA